MAARESEEDNKWTAGKRLKGESEKDDKFRRDMCSIFYA